MKIYFSNEDLSADTKFMLEKEFIKRRIFGNDIYYPLKLPTRKSCVAP